MKKISILTLILFLSQQLVQAQPELDADRINLSVVVPPQTDPLPESSSVMLENALIHAISSTGLAGIGSNSRFIVTAKVDLTQKTITRTVPSQQVYTLNLTLYIGDGLDGIAYSTHTLSTKGVGETPIKAYNNAFSRLNLNSKNFDNFVNKGKQRILQYYASNCDLLIEEANALAAVGEYDEAIWRLMTIPSTNSDCFKKALSFAGPIFQKKIDIECKSLLTKAMGIWNANQSYEGAQAAGKILATIHPNASCYNEINSLASTIGKRVLEVDNREWKFNEDYVLGLARERISVERELIKAYRDIGVAWGENQPQNITYRSFW